MEPKMNEDYVAGFMAKAAELGVTPEALLCKEGQQTYLSVSPHDKSPEVSFTPASGGTVSMPPQMMQRYDQAQQRKQQTAQQQRTGQLVQRYGFRPHPQQPGGSAKFQQKSQQMRQAAKARMGSLVSKGR